jgi:hypothetical protein
MTFLDFALFFWWALLLYLWNHIIPLLYCYIFLKCQLYIILLNWLSYQLSLTLQVIIAYNIKSNFIKIKNLIYPGLPLQLRPHTSCCAPVMLKLLLMEFFTWNLLKLYTFPRILILCLLSSDIIGIIDMLMFLKICTAQNMNIYSCYSGIYRCDKLLWNST